MHGLYLAWLKPEVEMIYRLFLFFTVSLVVARAHGQSAPQAVFEEGRPIVITFSDGRQAEVFHMEGPADIIENYSFKVSDNTCTDYYDGRKVNGKEMSMKCSFEIPHVSVGAILLWTKNPDSKKI